MIINLLIFFAVLSLLVFFHELGHFAAAKAFGIYVKRFSVGMPPRLFGVKIGETDYCLGALLFGGYVMMAGQEDVPLSEEEREREYGSVPEERWFKNRPVFERICVLLAGPFMNLVLAVLLYALIGLVGSYVPEWEVEARVGEIEAGAPTADAPLYRFRNGEAPDSEGEPDAHGWQIGDRILTINGREAENMTDLAIAAILGGEGRIHEIIIERIDDDGRPVRYLSRISPRVLDDTGHARFGVGPYETPIIREVMEGSAAEAAGLHAGDIIRYVDGEGVTLSGFVNYIENTEEGSLVAVEVERDGVPLPFEVQPRTVGRIQGIAIGAAGDDEDNPPVVLGVAPELEDMVNLRARDVIVAVNGAPASYASLRKMQESHPGGKLEFRVRRPAVMFGLLEPAATFMTTVDVAPVRAIGVGLRPQTVLQRVPPVRIVPHAFYQSYLAVERTVMTIVGLVRRTVSPKDLGGPVMIYSVTTQAAQAGYDWLIKITAFISVNLFILNLLPLPVLDGGQVVVNVAEAVRGKPLNEKILERLQQVGIMLLIALMLYVTFNDIERLIRSWLP